MIQVIDTYEEIKELLLLGSFDLERWKEYAAGISKELPGKIQDDIGGYDFDKQIVPVIQYLFRHREMADTAHRSFLKATENLEERCGKIPLGQMDSIVLFYMGLCSAAGWATELEGKPAILLGIEKIVELDWMDKRSMSALIYHELGHNWHFQNRKAGDFEDTPKGRALWQLYTEGVAMYFEQLMCSDPHFYHQDRNGWLSWCERNRHSVACEYVRRIENEESIQDFFGDWCSYSGHSDVGYYLGAETVRGILEERGLKYLMDLQMDEFEGWLRNEAHHK